MAKTYILVDESTDAQTELGPLYAKGWVGAFNGFHFVDGGAIVTVKITHPHAFDAIDENPKLTRLPSPLDPTPDAVKQEHIDKLHLPVRRRLAKKGLLDEDPQVAKGGKAVLRHKLKANVQISGRRLAEELHDLYKKQTKHLHPDF